MKDVILDTVCLNEFLAQYFNEFKLNREFVASEYLDSYTVKYINSILSHYENSINTFLVISSTFAFVEIARQFELIVENKYTLYQFHAFINQPPEWFLIADLDTSLFKPLLSIPASVNIDGASERIEWADALHVATAMSREDAYIATTDHRINAMELSVVRKG